MALIIVVQELDRKIFNLQQVSSAYSAADKWHIFWNLEVRFKLFFLMDSCSSDLAFQESD